MSRREVDLHGLFAEQAENVLEKEIVSAYFSGVTELIVIHGKGAGVLRETSYNTLFLHKDKWIEIVKGEDTNEIGDAGFLKVKMKAKETIIRKFYSRNKKLEEKTDESDYYSEVEAKKLEGKKKYLKRMRRLKEVKK